ncbi:MAG: redoxin domain-containing protein, partial [Deltaproteobacteria bacterium]|nr:redoxin domain-containing protein [Deltaproteobacteria bacterium]
MEERTDIITMKGNPLTLIGKELKVGDSAPDREVLDNNLSPVKLSSFRGKICVISSVPSLDTPVCDMETRRFNQEAGKLSAEIQMLTISM